MTADIVDLVAEAQKRARLYNDAGLRYGVADLLTALADELIAVQAELVEAKTEIRYWSNR